MKRLALIIIAVLALPSAALAMPHHCQTIACLQAQAHRNYSLHVPPAPRRTTTPLMAADFQANCLAHDGVGIVDLLRGQNASVMRVGIDPGRGGQGLECIRRAHAAGFRIYLTLNPANNDWTPAQFAAWVDQVLPQYAPYAWAVGVGNENDLPQPADTFLGGRGVVVTVRHGQSYVYHPAKVAKGVHREPTLTRYATSAVQRDLTNAGQDYRALFDAGAAEVAKIAPRAIRVFGEASPWAAGYIFQGWGTRPPLAQAVAFHCYNTTAPNTGLNEVPALAAWAKGQGLPLWCSEMAPVLNPAANEPWVHRDSWPGWNAKVAQMVVANPNVQMVSFFSGWNQDDPGLDGPPNPDDNQTHP